MDPRNVDERVVARVLERLNKALGDGDLVDRGDYRASSRYVGPKNEFAGKTYCGFEFDGRYFKVFADGEILVRDLPDGKDQRLNMVPISTWRR